MSFGASFRAVSQSAVADAAHHNVRLSHWRILFGGLLGVFFLGAAAQANTAQLVEATANRSTPQRVNLAQSIEDGVYFYGSAPQPDEIGAAYMVFEAQDADVVGAMYMPHSSFDCFRGQIDGNELALQITNSYTQEVYNYAIALVTPEDPIASIGSAAAPLQLDGFYDVGEPREAETEILAICQANLL